MIIADSVSVLAIDTSKSPAVSGMISARLSVTRTACDPSIVEMLFHDRKMPGASTPNSAARRMVATRSAKDSAMRAQPMACLTGLRSPPVLRRVVSTALSESWVTLRWPPVLG